MDGWMECGNDGLVSYGFHDTARLGQLDLVVLCAVLAV